ncbi:MAG: DNA alkylation repair protein [Ignavibacteria bacterium]
MEKLDLILDIIKENGNPANLEGMQRFGIRFDKAYGCNIPFLRKLAKQFKKDHDLAKRLWATGIHEARILAFLIDDPKEVTELQMEKWVRTLNSWDICDGLCSNLFRKTECAYAKASEWSGRNEEFVKRAGFVMMAVLAVHDKKAEDGVFVEFLDIIEKESKDERNFVKKAVNWALRQTGKRNAALHKKAIKCAERIEILHSRSAKWIARDALREFKSDTTIRILERRKKQ